MQIEHFAFNVKDPVAVADWYCANLGFTVTRKWEGAPFTHFLADSTGKVMIEIYCNSPDQVPDYPAMHFLQLHLAFVSEDPETDAQRLAGVDTKLVDDVRPPDGSILLMLAVTQNYLQPLLYLLGFISGICFSLALVSTGSSDDIYVG